MSRLDYCNAVLAGILQSTLESLQCIQNAAACLIHQLDVRDHVTPSHQVLHWLPIRCHIDFNCTIMYGIHTGRCPAYLEDVYVQQHSSTYWTTIDFQQQVCDATAANQVSRTRLLTCRTCCMEFTAT